MNITYFSIGLHYLHSLLPQVLHRDLKSANILIDNSGTAKITDFGLSKVKTETQTNTKTAAGTVQWSAPEFLQQVIPDPYQKILTIA